jgi:preprotein translocase subunit YajC
VVFADSTASGGSLLPYLSLLLLGAVAYFLLIRPQNKRRRDAMEMQRNIGPGDEVQTIGGLYGTVTEVDDDSATLEAAPGVHLRFARGAIGKVITRAEQPEVEDDAGDSDAENVVDKA